MFLETSVFIKYRMEFLKNFLLNISFILLTTVNLMRKGSCLIVAEAHLEPDQTTRATKGVRKSKALEGIGKGLTIFALTESTHFKLKSF